MGAAVFSGAGTLVAGGLAVGSPAAGATTTAAVATVAPAGGGPSTGTRACTMAGAIEGAQASPVIQPKDDVLVGLPGYYPQRDAATTMGDSGHSGAGSGGLVPVGSAPGANGGASRRSASSTGRRGAVMAGAIEGAQASPVIQPKDDVLVGLPGYYPQRDAATTMGDSGHSGAGSGGLVPVGSAPGANGGASGRSASSTGGAAPAHCG